MYEQEAIRRALSGLHASDGTLEEVMKMAEQKKANGTIKRGGKIALIAAALAALCMTTAFAADYVLNRREIFFFDTVAALAAAQRADQPEADTGSYSVPGSAAQNQDMETVAQNVANRLEFGYYGEETVLSDETAPTPETTWERRRVTECRDEDYGRIINEYLTGAAYADRLVIEGLLDWDLSALTERMTPDADGQIVVISRDADRQAIVRANALLGYTTETGERFQIEFDHRADTRYLQDREYILSSAYDACYVCTTEDQVEVLVKAYDGQVWASAVDAGTGNAVYLYAAGCTAAEMEALLNSLQFSDAMQAGA